MDTQKFIKHYLENIVDQNEEELRGCFCEDACIRWHNTNEQFTVEEFLRANCDYPGRWRGEIERIEYAGSVIITVAHVWGKDTSFHVTSFIQLAGEVIKTLDEYWGDDRQAPQWRAEKHIGKPIKQPVIR